MAGDINDNYGDFGSTVSIEVFTALAENLNSMIDAAPAGEIATIFVVLGTTPPLDPTIWQECNGSEITETLSPFRGQRTPNLADRYLKGALSANQSGLFGGTSQYNLAHNHTGQTQAVQFGSVNVDKVQLGSRDYEAAEFHTHFIPTDMGVMNFEPKHFTIKHFLKIR